MEHIAIDTAAAIAAPLSFSADLASLSAAVDFLAKRIIERRNSVPILGSIMFEGEPGGAIRLSGTDLDILASVTVAGHVAQPGAVCIDADSLQLALAKARKSHKGDVDVTDASNGRASVKAGRARFNLVTRPRDEFPNITPSGESSPPSGEYEAVAFTVPTGQFVADLAAVASCASKEESRDYLNGAAMQVRNLAGQDRLCLVATDCNAIAAASRPVPIGATGLADVILPTKAMAVIGHAAKLAGDAGEVQVTAYPARPARYRGDVQSSPYDKRLEDKGSCAKLAFDLGAVRIVAKMIDGTFPDWERPFAENLAASDASPALFPDLLPGAPVASIDRIAKAAKGLAIDWQPARNGLLGTVASDEGMLFGALNMRDAGACQRKGFDYQWQGREEAASYLLALAASRGLPDDAEMIARADAIKAAYGEPTNAHYNGEAPFGHATAHGPQIVLRGTRVVGMTWQGEHKRNSWSEAVTDWETLSERMVYHAERTDPIEGSYSILMPSEGPGQLTSASAIEGPDGITYPVAVSDTALAMTKEQVRALIGESCFEVVAVPIPASHPLRRFFHGGETAYVARWLYDQGDARLLVVKRDGRCFDSAKHGRSYLGRAEIDALIAGTWAPEGVADDAQPMPRPVAVTVQEAEPVHMPSASAPAGEAVERDDSVAPDSGDGGEALEGASEPVDIQVNNSVPVAQGDAQPDLAARLAEIEARLASIEAAAPPSAEYEAPLIGGIEPEAAALDDGDPRATGVARLKAAMAAERAAMPRRSAAHERAVRRAWAERARRRAQSDLDRRALIASDNYLKELAGERDEAVRSSESAWFQARLAQDMNRLNLGGARQWQARCEEVEAKRRRAVILAHRHWKMRLLGRSQRADIAEDERRQRAKRTRSTILARQRGGQMATLAGMVRRGAGELAQVKRNMADPTNPPRECDLAQLVGERDQARTANTALEQRCARMQAAVDQCAGTIEALASRVARAEAALRARAA